jgi:hypothetical protein
MYGYDWEYFPARLHTTREMIFFLENINNIDTIINDNDSKLTNFIFGDIYNPGLVNHSKKFIHRFTNKNANKNINKIIMEVTSRKVVYYKDIPLNYFYIHNRGFGSQKQTYNLVDKKLTDEEIDCDLQYITNLCKQIFNKNVEIHIIPHLNLKTKSTLDYISDRNNLVSLLERLCNKYNIKIHNIGKYIENNYTDIYLEDYMPNLTHYGNNYEKIRTILTNEII